MPLAISPSYLLPAISFRRQHSKTHPPSSATTPHRSDEESKFLSDHISYIRCGRCAAHLCMASQIISKGFMGRHGRAYLVTATDSTSNSLVFNASLPNTITHKPVPRQLATGAHTVSDISCAFCDSVLGWKYVAAEEESQKYKIGKFILETKRTSVTSSWDEQDSHVSAVCAKQASDVVEFDSEDDDECEDLFSGIWTPRLAARRRARKVNARSNAQEEME